MADDPIGSSLPSLSTTVGAALAAGAAVGGVLLDLGYWATRYELAYKWGFLASPFLLFDAREFVAAGTLFVATVLLGSATGAIVAAWLSLRKGAANRAAMLFWSAMLYQLLLVFWANANAPSLYAATRSYLGVFQLLAGFSMTSLLIGLRGPHRAKRPAGAVRLFAGALLLYFTLVLLPMAHPLPFVPRTRVVLNRTTAPSDTVWLLAVRDGMLATARESYMPITFVPLSSVVRLEGVPTDVEVVGWRGLLHRR